MSQTKYSTSRIGIYIRNSFSVLRRGQTPSLTLQQTEERIIVEDNGNNAESISTNTTNASYNPSRIQRSLIPNSSLRHEYEDSPNLSPSTNGKPYNASNSPLAQTVHKTRSHLVEINEDDETSVSSFNSYTPPTSISSSNGSNNDLTHAKWYYGNTNTVGKSHSRVVSEASHRSGSSGTSVVGAVSSIDNIMENITEGEGEDEIEIEIKNTNMNDLPKQEKREQQIEQGQSNLPNTEQISGKAASEGNDFSNGRNYDADDNSPLDPIRPVHGIGGPHLINDNNYVIDDDNFGHPVPDPYADQLEEQNIAYGEAYSDPYQASYVNQQGYSDQYVAYPEQYAYPGLPFGRSAPLPEDQFYANTSANYGNDHMHTVPHDSDFPMAIPSNWYSNEPRPQHSVLIAYSPSEQSYDASSYFPDYSAQMSPPLSSPSPSPMLSPEMSIRALSRSHSTERFAAPTKASLDQKLYTDIENTQNAIPQTSPTLPGFVHATLAKRSYNIYTPPQTKDKPLQANAGIISLSSSKSPLEKLSQTMRSLSLQSTRIESGQAGHEKKEENGAMVDVDGGVVAENDQSIQRRKEDNLTNDGKVEEYTSGKGMHLDRDTVEDNEKEQNGTISTQPGDRSSAGSTIANSLQRLQTAKPLRKQVLESPVDPPETRNFVGKSEGLYTQQRRAATRPDSQLMDFDLASHPQNTETNTRQETEFLPPRPQTDYLPSRPQTDILPYQQKTDISLSQEQANFLLSQQRNFVPPKQGPPPKPEPPPDALTDTLIASGQADIANQVLIMRRLQNASVSMYEQRSRSIVRRPKKPINPKDISGPQLIASSSSVKSIPIVHLDRDEDSENGSFARKVSLRENENTFSKSIRRIKDVFANDGENKSLKKKKRSNDILRLQVFNDTLSRKSVSEENLNRRYDTDGGLWRNNSTTSLNKDYQDSDRSMSMKSVSEDNATLVTGENDIVFPRPPPMYDLDALKRHAETVTKYSTSKKSSQSGESGNTSTRSSASAGRASLGKKASKELSKETIQEAEDDNRASQSSKLTVDVVSFRKNVTDDARDNTDSDSNTSFAPVSPLSQNSVDVSGSTTPQPLSPLGSLRSRRNSKSGSIKRDKPTTGSLRQNSKDSSTERSKRGANRNSKTSSKLLSIFSNFGNRSNNGTKNSLQVTTNSNSIPTIIHPNEQSDSMVGSPTEVSKPRNPVIRRTIIITKPVLPPLPDEAKSADSPDDHTDLDKKLHVGGIHIDSEGRKWYLTRVDEDAQSTTSARQSQNDKFLDIPANETLRNRPPTPVPSPNTRESILEPPYGIPIPPIPPLNSDALLSHRSSVSSKRASKQSVASSLSSTSRLRKSTGGKSIASAYGESLFDFYDYSDHEGDDNEQDNDSVYSRQDNDTENVDSPNDHFSYDYSSRPHSGLEENNFKHSVLFDSDALLEELEHQQHVEVLELADGSYVWQVVDGSRASNAGKFSQCFDEYYSKKNGEESDMEDSNRYSHLDYYHNYPSPLHLPGVQQSQSRVSSYLLPNSSQSSHSKRSSITSSDHQFDQLPQTSVYIAKDVSLPRLIEEMSKGLNRFELSSNDHENGNYIYGGEVSAGGTGVVGETTVEEKLDQVMKVLGVDEKGIYVPN
ncbi:1221_t:CDS:2 [Paraglomus brasilianum]|uniref:1221_t:CDS:1 n=1 Tax=Paraglomus brasilianum TaxID=144538 RepID=A0A9N8W0N1_9GLOM|nr:1221_t:CDS:2 [Paraglomus brasilianum]